LSDFEKEWVAKDKSDTGKDLLGSRAKSTVAEDVRPRLGRRSVQR
jgi:hypothetical protein